MQPLYEAVRSGDRERVKSLVAADPPLAIFAAAMLGDTAELETLLAGNRSLLTAVSPAGWFPPHLAAPFAPTGAVRLLFSTGAQARAPAPTPPPNTPPHPPTPRPPPPT